MKLIDGVRRSGDEWMKEGTQDEVAVLFICFRTIFSSLLREKKRWAREFIIVRVNEVKVKRGSRMMKGDVC